GGLGRGNGGEAAYRAEVPRLAIILKAMGNRLKNLKDAPSKLAYFYKDSYPVDDEAVQRYLQVTGGPSRLAALAGRFESLDRWDRGTIEEATRVLAGELGVDAADLIHPCRVALTGQAVSPHIFTVIHLLGRDKTIQRLQAPVSQTGTSIGG
ncbi:MAG: hypothetical protein P8181_17130, partial [bacterium]